MLDAQVSNLLQKIGEIFKFIGIMLQKSKFELWKKRDYGGRTITDSKHLFAQWTSQGLNLGPPDYESVALTN